MDELDGLPTGKLLELCLGKNSTEDAWTELVRRIQKIIRGTIYRCLKRWTSPTRDSIDEVSQRTLLKLWANNQAILRRFTFCGDKAFEGYMRLVAASVAKDYGKQEMRAPFDPIPEDHDCKDKGPLPHDKALVEEVYGFLRERCPELECDMFWCHHHLGLSGREISEMLNKGIKEVEYILWKLMRLLRDEFGDGSHD